MVEEELIPLRKAAEIAKVTKQALYVALKKRGLKAIMKNGRYYLTKNSIDDYRINKYNRDLRKVDGEYIFDLTKGHFSIQQVCKVFSSSLGCPYSFQHLYYLLRTGQLRGFRKGKAWVIPKDEAIALLEKEMEHHKEKSKMI